MVPEDLLFWVAPLDKWVDHAAGVLCRRHADAMVVPKGWTLDDRREPAPRLFRPRADQTGSTPRPTRRRPTRRDVDAGVQLELVGADAPGAPPEATPRTSPEPEPHGAWTPSFDVDDDLDGLLEVRSPLLARAFRGTDRPRR